jgi:cyclase
MIRQHQQTTETLDAGVTAFLQGDGGWCLNNAGVVVGARRTIVIDTAATVSRAVRLRQVVDDLGRGAPVTVVNTHHHGDHFFGNCVFDPDVTIVAHDLARTEMIETGTGLQKLWPDVDWGDVELRLPTVTFPDRLTLDAGDFAVELHHVGPAHTTNDVVAWLPDQAVLFAGDVVFNGVTPFALMGSVRGSLAAVERLRRFPATRIVPGHGPVGGPELLDATAGYLRWIQHIATAGLAAGLTPLDLARETALGEYAELVDSERLVGNLVRAYSEARGERTGVPLDVVRAFQLMVEFHGGLPACFA